MTPIAQGLELMLYGMGTVIVFLSLLVLATMTMSRLAQRFAVTETASSTIRQTEDEVDPAVVAAISAAVHRYRSRRK